MSLEDGGSPLNARFEDWHDLDRLDRYAELLLAVHTNGELIANRQSLKRSHLTLHRHGIMHGEVSLLNICRRTKENQVCFVDFDRASLISRLPRDDGSRAMADETAILQDLRII